MASSGRRAVTPMVARLRDALNGRKTIDANRYHKELAPKDAPLPNLPGGPSHLLSANYYCNRDGRRAKEAPVIMTNTSQRLLSASTGSLPVVKAQKFDKPPTAGTHYNPEVDMDNDAYWDVVGDRDTPWEEYNSERKFNKPDA